MPVSSSPPFEPPYLTAEEIEAPLPPSPAGRWARLKDRLEEAGCFGPGQIGGRRWPIGCVSLEVTQRCNLDCSLCYLSPSTPRRSGTSPWKNCFAAST